MDATRNPLPCAILTSTFSRTFCLEHRAPPARHVLGSSEVIVARRKPSSSTKPRLLRRGFTFSGPYLGVRKRPRLATTVKGREFCRLQNRLQQIFVRAWLGHGDEQQPRY